jgi:glycosyltransferase involved in cell wall biosynthesis
MLDAVDLLLVPSATEGMPAVVVEAAARGVPVVASAVGGIPGMVRGSIGVLVPPDAGARGYAAAAEDLLRAGSRVSAEDRRSLLLQHDLDRLASHWAELLGSVAQPSGTPPAGPPPNARR